MAIRAKNQTKRSFDVVTRIVNELEGFDVETVVHILATVHTWLQVTPGDLRSVETLSTGRKSRHVDHRPEPESETEGAFSTRDDVSPKDFLIQKRPTTDVERLACLAYYLTHYRTTPHFKTVDLSKLNTEAAQRKFANPAQTAKDAIRAGLLTHAAKKGHRQVSAMGEKYVEELPDRDAAHAVRRRMTPRRKKRVSSARTTRAGAKST